MVNVLVIESVGYCNATCVYCPRGTGILKDRGRRSLIDERTLEKALSFAKLGKNAAIYLHLRGEPFLHPDLADVVKSVRKAGFLAYTATNMIVINEEKIKKVLLAGINELQLHLSAGLTKCKLDDLLYKVHQVRRLNWKLRNNGCRLELNYALQGSETKEQLFSVLSSSRYFDPSMDVSFFKPHDWPNMTKRKTGGLKNGCAWRKENACAVLADGRVVICCLDQWGMSASTNINDVSELKIEHLSDVRICRGCTEFDRMEWLSDNAVSTPVVQVGKRILEEEI